MSGVIAVALDFDPVPSASRQLSVGVAPVSGKDAVVGVFVAETGEPPEGLPSRTDLAAAGFTGARGRTLRLPGTPLQVAVGIGDPATLTSAAVRDVAAAFALAAAGHARLALPLDTLTDPAATLDWYGAAVEGIVLAR